MKVAYVTTYHISEIGKFSGLGYYIHQSLKNQGVSLALIGPLKERCPLLLSVKQRLYKVLLKKRYLRAREPFVLKNFARQVERKLFNLDVEIVFSPSSIPICYLNCRQPMVFWTDAVFAGMVDYYPEFSNLCNESVRNGNKMEKAALERCKMAIYSSEWAAETAVKHYQVNAEKVRVVPFGANIDSDNDLNAIKRIVNSRPSDICKLLFLSVDWLRKGGNLALKMADELNKSGMKTELWVVGCQPETNGKLPDYVRTIGFVDKSTRNGLRQMNKLLAGSHFLVLPTRADCTPVVFSEANAFGVPCLSTNIGGIPTIIKDDVNGKLFSVEADIWEYCTFISRLFSNYDRYKEMALTSFKEYQSRLNWGTSGSAVRKLLEEML